MREWGIAQQQIASWSEKVIPAPLNTPAQNFDRGMEEVWELHDAVKADDGTPQTRKEINEEATDVIIRMIGIVVSAGGNVAELLDKKIQVMHEKYNPDKIQGDLQQGVPFDVTMARHKTAWQQKTNPPKQPAPRPRVM